ncbi:MAG: TatD family hydrolase, partial [Candidatus Dormibacterales bacterium]
MPAALAEARQAGVSRLITMGVDLKSSRGAVALAEAHPEVLAGVGHHPSSEGEPDLEALRRLLRHPKVVAVGEVGLDGSFPEGASGRRHEWFDAMCGLAAEAGLPVSVHSRE